MIVQLLKEQIKSDEMPSSLLGHLHRILDLADKVADEIVCEETDLLVEIMSRMFEVMKNIAEFLCEYVKRGRFSRWSLLWILQILMVAERAGAALFSSKDKDRIKGLDDELASVIKHFLSAVNVEALLLARTTGERSLSQYSMCPLLIALCRAEASTQAA